MLQITQYTPEGQGVPVGGEMTAAQLRAYFGLSAARRVPTYAKRPPCVKCGGSTLGRSYHYVDGQIVHDHCPRQAQGTKVA